MAMCFDGTEVSLQQQRFLRNEEALRGRVRDQCDEIVTNGLQARKGSCVGRGRPWSWKLTSHLGCIQVAALESAEAKPNAKKIGCGAIKGIENGARRRHGAAPI